MNMLLLRFYRLIVWRSVHYYAGLIVMNAGERWKYESGSIIIQASPGYPYAHVGAVKIYVNEILVFDASKDAGLEVYRHGSWVSDIIKFGRSIQFDLRQQQRETQRRNFEPLSKRKRKKRKDDI